MQAAAAPEPDRSGVGAPGRSAAATHGQELPALTGLRFVAAFAVLLAHGIQSVLHDHDAPGSAIYWLTPSSAFGMTLFFVLSGFVIHYNYADLVTAQRLRGVAAFLWARFARLYPLFLLMMLVYVLVSGRTFDFLAGQHQRIDSIPRALPYFLLSIQSWFYTLIDGRPLIVAIGGGSPLTWSISTEWFFYLVYPGIAWLILRTRTPWLTAAIVVLWCALWIRFSTGLYDRSPQIDAWAIERFGPMAGMRQHQDDSFVRWLLYFSPYLRIGEFVLGTLVAQLYVQLRAGKVVTGGENLLGSALFLVAAASIVPITYCNYSPHVGINIFRRMNMNFAMAPTAALLVFCAARYRGAVLRWLTLRPVVALGDASYSIYLVHYVVLMSAFRLTGSAVHGVGYEVVKLLLLIGVIFLISLLLYAYYEAPARKWLRRRWRGNCSLVALAQAPATIGSVRPEQAGGGERV